MNDYEKPPLGARPSWFKIPHRNKELAEAIYRYSDCGEKCFTQEKLKMIKEWATEIVGNCDTGLKILEISEEKQ